ncbi:MAG: NYN domain-containing protein [Candidatus Lokiarchaeota archaeon]|nr:NYN domain-containing protein [Candidatus Lokiarchaeota archaeon]
MRKRIAIYIDNSNIFNGFRKYNIKVDYEKLKNLIAQNRLVVGIYLYEGIIYPISSEKVNWYKGLSKKSGYIIRASFDKHTTDNAIEKKIDVKLAIDMISHAYENLYDISALVSGDGDFLPVVKKLKELKKDVEIWGFEYSMANALKEEISRERIFYFDQYLNRIRL